jgi:Domain of unknown function (DUF4351)
MSTGSITKLNNHYIPMTRFPHDEKEPEEEDLMMQLSPLFLEKIQAAEQQAKTEEVQALILRQLKRQVGEVPIELETQVRALPLEQLEELGEALLDFTGVVDLERFLDS